MSKGVIMKKKNEVPGRLITKSVRLTAEDQARLDRLCLLFSPYAKLSEGKAISAALKIAEEKLSKGARS